MKENGAGTLAMEFDLRHPRLADGETRGRKRAKISAFVERSVGSSVYYGENL
jgi:hypothetical protein